MSALEHSSIWIAAEYTLPMTYSIREPGTSATFTKAIPVPGTATVKLALLRVAIEMYGLEYTRQRIFEVIRAIDVHIRPPAMIGISGQFLKTFKNRSDNKGDVQMSVVHREHCQTLDNMTIYVRCNMNVKNMLETLLMSIGYWGQGNSFAYCLSVQSSEPRLSECATKLSSISTIGLKGYETCYLNDLDVHATWDDILTGEGISLALYVLPIRIAEQKRKGRVLRFHPLPNSLNNNNS
jgi:hypothetical protein